MHLRATPPGRPTRRGIRRRTEAILAAMAIAAASFGIIATAATTAEAAGTGTVTGYQGLCLDDYAASSADGTKVDLYTCNGTGAQQWTVASNGTLQINGKCMDITGASTSDGALIELWDCNNGGNQIWQPQANGELLNPASGKCLDDPGFNATPGTQLDIWDCNAGANQIWNVPGGSGGGTSPAPPTGGSLGANVVVISPSMSVSSIASQLNAIGTQQNPNQFGTQRYEILFQPGTYGSASNPLDFQIGYYESVEGLGQNPGQVVINGTIDSWNQCTGGDQTQCYATDNFWRSVSNLTINVTGLTGCFAGYDVWAASQAAPMRRVEINGNVTLMDFCDGTPDWASGGFIADSELNGKVESGSQQQYIVRNTSIGSWTNGVWNQVFSGDPGAPAQSFGSTSLQAGGPQPYTTLATSPTTEEAPYLYTDSSGNYQVFVPSVKTNSSGASWANGNTPGTSLSLNTFYVVNSASTIAQINAALGAGDNLLFTPGVYSYNQTINVTKADTKVIGLGFATIVPTAGQTTINVADVNGVNVSGLILDAGPTTSPTLLTVGTPGSTTSHASDPVSIDDVFFRVGGATAGSVTDAFIDNSNNSILDDIWSWRADHGAGSNSWTTDTAATGLTVNGNNVTSYGLAVEHYQQNETVWNGQGGTVIFFQNENPYDVPNQSSWMATSTQNGYPGFLVATNVTTFQGYGMGVYSNFTTGPAIESSMAFQAPTTSGVVFHDIFTKWLNNNGGIQSVIDGTGAAVNSGNTNPVNIVTYN